MQITKNLSNRYLLFILAVVGLIFLRSSLGKITGGEFPASLGKTLAFFSSKNPYPFVKDFLQNIAIPNSALFGLLTMWGEFLIGLSLIICALFLTFSSKRNRAVILLLIAGSGGGMFLNAVFWLAAGWTSPSTESVNLLMFTVELSGLIYGLNLLKD